MNVLQLLEKDMNEGTNNLCGIYRTEDGCDDCPVKDYTDEDFCKDENISTEKHKVLLKEVLGAMKNLNPHK